jgi:ribosomal protein L19E
MTKEQARQEEREMFMEEIARLRKTIKKLEEERDAYKLMWGETIHKLRSLEDLLYQENTNAVRSD